MEYEELAEKCTEAGLVITEMDFSTRAKGLCVGNYIFIDKGLSQVEKLCILAEEVGHYFTTVGNIIDRKKSGCNKQENTARAFAYNMLIGLEGIVEAGKSPLQRNCDIAELLGVSESFYVEAMEYYRQYYGSYRDYKGCRIYFEPYLYVENK